MAVGSEEHLDPRREREQEQRLSTWQKWLEESKRLNQVVLAEIKGVPPDVDQLLDAARADLEERDVGLSGGGK